MDMTQHQDGTLPTSMYETLTGLKVPKLDAGEVRMAKLKDGRRVIFERPQGTDVVFVLMYSSILKLDPE